MSDQEQFDDVTAKELSEVQIQTQSNQFDKGQVQVALYYDTCDEFLYDIGADLEQAISSSLPVQSQKILGGWSPLFPLLEFVLISISGIAATQFISGFFNEAGKDFYNLIKNKLTTGKNKTPVLISISIVNDEMIIKGYIQSNDYKTIAEAIKAAYQIIDDAAQKSNINLEKIPLDQPLSYRDINNKGVRTVCHSNLQFQYSYNTTSQKWELKSIHKVEDNNLPRIDS